MSAPYTVRVVRKLIDAGFSGGDVLNAIWSCRQALRGDEDAGDTWTGECSDALASEVHEAVKSDRDCGEDMSALMARVEEMLLEQLKREKREGWGEE